MNENFYASLPSLEKFDLVARFDLYKSVPSDWHVLITDIRGSTQAIEQGRYKDVNTLGASTIIAVLNAVGETELPFVFGGDGATLLVPTSALPACRKALLSSRYLAKEAFGLELRTGFVPIARIQEDGKSVLVAKVRISPHYTQAMFAGGGIAWAEHLVKDPAPNNPYVLQEAGTSSPELFEGLECRWSDVRVPQKEIVSLLIAARGESTDERASIYKKCLSEIDAIFSSHPTPPEPVTTTALKLSFSVKRLLSEAKVRTVGLGAWARTKYLASIFVGNILGLYFFKSDKKHFGTDWKQYKADLLQNTDSKKFDDTLRMVLSAAPGQKRKLEDWLESQKQSRTIFYGLHASSHALMTCLVFDRQGRHIHFVDGGDGGYAAAAKVLKKQMASADA